MLVFVLVINMLIFLFNVFYSLGFNVLKYVWGFVLFVNWFGEYEFGILFINFFVLVIVLVIFCLVGVCMIVVFSVFINFCFLILNFFGI